MGPNKGSGGGGRLQEGGREGEGGQAPRGEEGARGGTRERGKRARRMSLHNAHPLTSIYVATHLTLTPRRNAAVSADYLLHAMNEPTRGQDLQADAHAV
jgi:hypothetical protein